MNIASTRSISQYADHLRQKLLDPNDKIAISSLSLFNFIKHKSKPKIKINGTITVIKFGIK